MSREPSMRSVLDDIASASVPEPRQSFVADLELRLATLIASSTEGDLVPDIELTPPASPRARTKRVAAAASAGLCALAAVAGIWTAGHGAAPSHDVATAAPSLANGSDSSSPGQRSGSVDVTAGLDDAAAAAGGRSSVARGGSTGLGEVTSPTTAAGEEAVTSSAFTAAKDPVAAGPAPTPTGDDRAPATLGLTASGTAARVFLSWERYDGDDFEAYLVLRAAHPDAPDHPDASGRSLMLLRIENRDMTSHQDTPKVGTNARYRVVVVRKDGTVAARSAAVAPTMTLTPTKSELGFRDL